MKRSSYAKQKTAGDGDAGDRHALAGEQSANDDDRRSDSRRPDKEKEAADTDRSVRGITSSMEAWEKRTGQQKTRRAKQSKEWATATGSAKIRVAETYDSKSQTLRDQIIFNQWGQTVVKCLLWHECDIEGEEGSEKATFLLTNSAEILYNMCERETEPEDRNIHCFSHLLRQAFMPKISNNEL